MKKKIILALIFIALLIAIFMPAEAIGLEKGFKEFAIIFYAAASVLLCWISVPICWNYACDSGWSSVASIVFAFIGIYIALPVAIYQLFKTAA